MRNLMLFRSNTVRHQVVVLIFFLIAIAGKTQTCKSESKKIAGKWQYLSGSGGFTGKGPGWSPASNIVFQYRRNGSFTKFENGKKVEQDRFKIEVKPSALSTFIYKKLPAQQFMMRGDTLFLSETVADGFQYVFLRKK